MREVSIENLVSVLKGARLKKENMPIFFIGAGASVTGNIPNANELAKEILRDFSDNPAFSNLNDDEKKYFNIIEKFPEANVKSILKKYIQNSKINITHLYLANLFNAVYVDYFLTTNFDNLLLRALVLYNIIPPVYDMAFLKSNNTIYYEKKSIVYLHGQWHNFWNLNNETNIKNIDKPILNLFYFIKDRPWIFIGYSGSDIIFKFIEKLNRFDNGIYWVTHNNNEPNKNVSEYLNNIRLGAFTIKGYDADSFMIKLNNELNLGQPALLEKPFTSLKNTLSGINFIPKEKEFIGVKESLDKVNINVEKAIDVFEKKSIDDFEEKKEKLKKAI